MLSGKTAHRLTIGAVVMLVLVLAVPATAAPPRDKVTGTYTYFALENPSQWRTVSVSAHAADPVKGTWEWITPSGTWGGPITCLRVSGDEAWLAGPDWEGPGGVFMYVQDGGTPGRSGDIAFTWHTDLGQPFDEVEALCEAMDPQPWFELSPWPVVSGNLNVWDAS